MSSFDLADAFEQMWQKRRYVRRPKSVCAPPLQSNTGECLDEAGTASCS